MTNDEYDEKDENDADGDVGRPRWQRRRSPSRTTRELSFPQRYEAARLRRKRTSRDYGWGDNSTTMRMVLRNRNGDESVREMRRRALETEEAGCRRQERDHVRRAA